jgi:eukaryotic-like serine/threonine-protein kinase
MRTFPTTEDIDTTDDVLAGRASYCPVCFEAFSPLCARCPIHGAELIVGQPFAGRYCLLGVLGEGAMATVYRGVQLPINRPVAIKVMRSDLGRDDSGARRFVREAQLLKRVSHPNVVHCCDCGEAAGQPYVVMELLRGRTLETALAAERPFSVRRTCELALQLADALAAAHAQDVVHRDLKPSNVLLLTDIDDWVKVLDFGLAKPCEYDGLNDITALGVVLGTPLYMAPEAVRADATDFRTDLYALGCIVHEMLTGSSPFDSDSGAMVARTRAGGVTRAHRSTARKAGA